MENAKTALSVRLTQRQCVVQLGCCSHSLERMHDKIRKIVISDSSTHCFQSSTTRMRILVLIKHHMNAQLFLIKHHTNAHFVSQISPRIECSHADPRADRGPVLVSELAGAPHGVSLLQGRAQPFQRHRMSRVVERRGSMGRVQRHCVSTLYPPSSI